MAPEKKANKRKAPATAPSAPAVNEHPPSKKSKTTKEKPAKSQVTKAKSSNVKPAKENGVVNGAKVKELPVKVDKKPSKEVKPRKRAADFLSDDEDEPEKDEVVEPKSKAEKASQPKKKAKSEKQTKDQKSTEKFSADAVSKEKSAVTPEKTMASPKTEKPVKEAKPAKEEAALESDADSDSAEDDQTLALIRGFESSGEEDLSGDEGFEPGQEIPKIPDSKKVMKAIRQKKKKNEVPEEPGTVYVGRIPHGFYEVEMRAYFTQFGEISRLRLSRNRVTGRSKHYAFIEFMSTSVAKVVAATMQNYLMFGHILKCRYIPNDQIHPSMWKGANRRFKRTPWNQIEKRRLEAGKSREEWTKAIGKESSKRAKKAEKMKALGYEYEIPELKAVEDVPLALPAAEKVEDGTEPAVAAIEEKEAKETPKKAKSKGKAAAADEKTATPKPVADSKSQKDEKKIPEPVKKPTEKESKKPKKKASGESAATPEKSAKEQKVLKPASKGKSETAKPVKQTTEKLKKAKKAKA